MYTWYLINKIILPTLRKANTAATHEEQEAVPNIPAINPEVPPTMLVPVFLADFLSL